MMFSLEVPETLFLKLQKNEGKWFCIQKKDEKCIKNFHRLTKVNGIQDYLGTHYLQTYLLETRNIDPRLNDDLILIQLCDVECDVADTRWAGEVLAGKELVNKLCNQIASEIKYIIKDCLWEMDQNDALAKLKNLFDIIPPEIFLKNQDILVDSLNKSIIDNMDKIKDKPYFKILEKKKICSQLLKYIKNNSIKTKTQELKIQNEKRTKKLNSLESYSPNLSLDDFEEKY